MVTDAYLVLFVVTFITYLDIKMSHRLRVRELFLKSENPHQFPE